MKKIAVVLAGIALVASSPNAFAERSIEAIPGGRHAGGTSSFWSYFFGL